MVDFVSFMSVFMIDVCVFVSLPLPIINLLLSMGADRTDCNSSWSDDFWSTYERNRIYNVFASCALVITRIWYTSEAKTLTLFLKTNCNTQDLRHRKTLHVAVFLTSTIYAIVVDFVVFAWTFDAPSVCGSDSKLARLLCDSVDTGLQSVFFLYCVNTIALIFSAALLTYNLK
jgi:hypothetical protein